jgi:hypothetical protein
MSLLSTATSWTIDEDNISKKRIPQIRKTVKNHASSPSKIEPLGQPLQGSCVFQSSHESFTPGKDAVNYQPPTMEDAAKQLEERNQRVHELLNHITAVNGMNAGSKLADFQPPEYPVQTHTKKFGEDEQQQQMEEFIAPVLATSSEIPDHSNELQHTVPQINMQRGTNIYPYRDNEHLSNYNHIYRENPLFQKQPFSQSQLQNESHGNDPHTKAYHKEMQKMHEKINYMVRILEDLKVEKTDNVMEEFIMFSLLGVFVIFVVDSFSKSAKYVR